MRSIDLKQAYCQRARMRIAFLLWLVLSPVQLLQAGSLRLWLDSFQVGDAMAYRSGQTVGILRLISHEPLSWQQRQVDSSTFFATPDWTHLLQGESAQQGLFLSDSSATPTSFWQMLLELPLEPVIKPRSWRPKLAILANLSEPIEWSVWQVKLPENSILPSTIRTLTLYVASGDALKAAGLPSPWPYWIENHDTLHKWASFLVKFERANAHEPASQPPCYLP